MTATDPRRNSLLGAALRGRARSAAALTGIAATLLTGGLVVGVATSKDATASGTTDSTQTGDQTGTQDGTSESSSSSTSGSSSSTADNGQVGSVDQNQDSQGGSNGS